MIIAIVGIVHEYDLLPYYLAHYRALGVQRFVTACEPDALDRSGALARLLAAQPDVTVVDLPKWFRRSGVAGMIEEEVRPRVASAQDWLIPADLDELNQYPCGLRELIEELDQNRETHVMGQLRDRLAHDGVLAEALPFERGVPLWEQYPLEADVTGRIVRGRRDKVLLSRGDLAWSGGHHGLRESTNNAPYAYPGIAHHFKWRSGLLRVLASRVQNERRSGMPWREESVRLDDYLRRHGRISPQDVAAVPGYLPSRGDPVGIPG
jgi:hypothetical protein